jgi:uncharacterized protein (DUF2461 family)
MYAPQPAQLLAVRQHIVHNVRRLRTLVESPSFRKTVGALDGERLQRVPRGFDRDHEAADYLRFRQFLAGRDFPPRLAASPRFYGELIKVFKQVAPLTRFLNEPLHERDPGGFAKADPARARGAPSTLRVG